MSESARSGRLVFFCGAGVSTLAPSTSPSWWDIYVAAAAALRDRFREGFPEIAIEIDLDQLLKPPLQTQQLADLVVSQFAGATFVENLTVVDIADPNENHVLLAALSALGHVRGIVTTNWDTLLERSAVVGGTSYTVVAPAIHGRRASGTGVTLIKLHGSAVDGLRLIETSSHKAREIDPQLASSWRSMITGADLLVLGYSGADLNFGAARAFFADFLASDGTIWWLSRPGSQPRVPENVRQRLTIIEGTLPEMLRSLASTLGATPFPTPLAGRDAQLALKSVMDAWSKELHVGRWSAALFMQSLGTRVQKNFRGSPLGQALIELARNAARQFDVGAEIRVEDLPVAGFLSMSGTEATAHLDVEDAVAMLRASVNIFEATHQGLANTKDGAPESERERLMNLSSGWSNYGQAALLSGHGKDAFSAAFQQSLRYAYLAGHAQNFLIALTNIIHYGFEYHAVRRCIRILDDGIRVADRIGAVQSSVEMRLHLAGFHLDRNEVWAASEALAEAQRLATAVFDRNSLKLVELLLAYVLLKRGKIRDGLATIAAVLAASPHQVFLSGAVEELRKYLDVIGVPQKGRFGLDLPQDKVDEYAAAIEAQIAAAHDKKELPWQGRHCSVSESSSVDQDHMKALFFLGVEEFASHAARTAEIGLHVAAGMLRRGYFFEAYCSARNVAGNVEARPSEKGYAYTFLAIACAELGRLGDVEPHLNEATKAFALAGESLPLDTIEAGLWHAIQSDDVSAAVEWAGRIGDAIRGQPERASYCYETASKIDSWGEPMDAVGRSFRDAVAAASGFSIAARPSTSGPSASPFRRFMGSSAELRARYHKNGVSIIQQAQDALADDNPDEALNVLDSLDKEVPEGLPDHLAGLALGLQVRALGSKVEPAKLNKAMDVQRERMLHRFAFAALARLEAAIAAESLHRHAPQTAADVVSRRAFIGELSEDPRAKTSLLFWEAHLDALLGRTPTHLPRMRLAQVAVRYYETLESRLLDSDDERNGIERSAVVSTQGPMAQDEGPVMEPGEYRTIARNSTHLAEVDTALAAALRGLRRSLQPSWSAAQLRGERANWLLRNRMYEEAVADFLDIEKEFRAGDDLSGALNAMAGRARALSRSGQFDDGVAVFQTAVDEVGDGSLRANLLLGLASAYLLEGTERRDPIDLILVDKAVATYDAAIGVASLGERERAYARLGLARALGAKGQQERALQELDRAVAELSHLGAPEAKTLIENRDVFVDGGWSSLGLA